MLEEQRHIVVGMGGLGREVASYLLNSGLSDVVFSAEASFYEPFEWMGIGSQPLGDCQEGVVVLAIGDGAVRSRVASSLSTGLRLGTFNFGSDRRSNVTLGEGSILCPGVQVTVDVKLGKGVFVNLNCTIGHDSILDDFVTLNPGVHVSGNCHLGEQCTIGTGAVIRDGVRICPNTTVGMGAVVVKDIDEPGVYVGNTARKIK